MPSGCLVTHKTIQFIQKAFKGAEILRCNPLKWNRALNRAELTTSTRHLYAWKLNIALTFIYYTFLLCKFALAFRGPSTLFDKVYSAFMISYYLVPVLMQISFLRHSTEILRTLNDALNLAAAFEAKYVTTKVKCKAARRWELIIAVVYYAFNTNICLLTLNTLLRPHSPECLASVFPEGSVGIELARLPAFLFQVYIFSSYIYNVHVLTFIFVANSCAVLPMIPELGEGHSMTRQALRQPNTVTSIYRALQVQLATYNLAFSVMIPGTKLTIIPFTVMCTYGMIRLEGLSAVSLGFISFNCTAYLQVLYYTFADYHHKSSAVLSKLNRVPQGIMETRTRQIFQKMLLSMAPLKSKIGAMYFVDKFMVLTIFKIIVDWTVNALLTAD